jgi:lipopolysaccharide biosynthesis regulator YciM
VTTKRLNQQVTRNSRHAVDCAELLNSEQAIEVNIAIMRAFVRLRQMLETNEELNRKFAAVIRKLSTHDKYFRVVFDELRKLTETPTSSRRQIGFKKNS